MGWISDEQCKQDLPVILISLPLSPQQVLPRPKICFSTSEVGLLSYATKKRENYVYGGPLYYILTFRINLPSTVKGVSTKHYVSHFFSFSFQLPPVVLRVFVTCFPLAFVSYSHSPMSRYINCMFTSARPPLGSVCARSGLHVCHQVRFLLVPVSPNLSSQVSSSGLLSFL